ncbi:MAG: hypothetical protein AAFV62_04620, partial [Pseudomonadota bacterium]
MSASSSAKTTETAKSQEPKPEASAAGSPTASAEKTQASAATETKKATGTTGDTAAAAASPKTAEASTKAAASSQTPPPPQPPAKSGGGFGSSLFGGLIGAVIGGGAVLFGAPMIGDSLPENLRIARESDVSTELASLETELNARLDGAATKIAGIEEQAKTFATAEALSETTDASQAARDELSRDRAKTETTLRNEIDVVGETMNKVTGQLSDRYDEQLKELNSIRDQVSILATATAANRVQEGAEGGDEISPGTLARLALLEGRIRQLQGQLDAMPEQLAAAPDFSRLDLLEKRVTELEIATPAAACSAAFTVGLFSNSVTRFSTRSRRVRWRGWP